MLTEEYEHLSSVQAACTPLFTIWARHAPYLNVVGDNGRHPFFCFGKEQVRRIAHVREKKKLKQKNTTH